MVSKIKEEKNYDGKKFLILHSIITIKLCVESYFVQSVSFSHKFNGVKVSEFFF